MLSLPTYSSCSGVATWWTKIFQALELQTDAFALSFYHTLAQIPGMMLASGLVDKAGRRPLVITGFGGGFITLFLISQLATKIEHSAAGEQHGHGFKVLCLACLWSIALCVSWLALDCLSAESFPTKVRSTGRGVCVATGRVAGFCVQFMYGPLVGQGKISYMMGLASLFSVLGIVASSRTTDTTNVDLQDHWDGTEGAAEASCPQETTKRISFSEQQHSKYLSIEPNV